MEKKFKQNESNSQRVIDILVGHFIEVKDSKNHKWMRDYLDTIKWSLEDYEECGYNMSRQRRKYEIVDKWLKNEN